MKSSIAVLLTALLAMTVLPSTSAVSTSVRAELDTAQVGATSATPPLVTRGVVQLGGETPGPVAAGALQPAAAPALSSKALPVNEEFVWVHDADIRDFSNFDTAWTAFEKIFPNSVRSLVRHPDVADSVEIDTLIRKRMQLQAKTQNKRPAIEHPMGRSYDPPSSYVVWLRHGDRAFGKKHYSERRRVIEISALLRMQDIDKLRDSVPGSAAKTQEFIEGLRTSGWSTLYM